MNTTVLRAGMADVIAHAFYRIGYRPRESLLLVGLYGPRNRIGLSIRVDLPPTSQHRFPLDDHVRLLREHGDDAVIVLVVSDRADRPARRSAGRAAPPRPPYQRLAREVRRRLRAEGFEVLDVIHVGESAWRSTVCRDPDCCPPEGRPLTEVTESPLAAWHVSQGTVLAQSEAALVADVEPHPGPDPDVGREPGAGRAPDGPPIGPAPVVPSRSATESLRRWRELLGDGSGPPDAPGAVLPDVRWLAGALRHRGFRDAVMLTLLPETGSAADDAVLGRPGREAAFDGLFDSPPDDELLARGTALLAAVARTSPPGERADALAVLAWAAWWAGEGARGRLLAGRALTDQPSHTLAALVDQLLFAGVTPGWAKRRAG